MRQRLIEFLGGDTLGHAQLSGDVDGVFHKLSRHPQMVHISDNPGYWDARLIPGEGSIDWPRVAELLDNISSPVDSSSKWPHVITIQYKPPWTAAVAAESSLPPCRKLRLINWHRFVLKPGCKAQSK